VAVVQISRIQVRRGRKGTTNIPQLASGEIGWAVDTQELYIGNGSVSEGAPFVGNTKILTAADDIFTLADQYEYRSEDSIIQTGATARTAVKRTLQSRLDFDVYVADFGAQHDTSVIQTAALQRAIDNIFLNTTTSPENRYILNLGPGLYRIDNSLKLPPYATLRGAGKDKTIIEQTANQPIFITVNGSSTIGNYDETTALSAANQARNIEVSGMTLRYENAASNIYNTALDLQSCRDSYFHDLMLKGYWDGDGDQAASIAINLKSFSGSVRSNSNLFENIDIEGFAYGVSSSHDIENNTFKSMNFSTLQIAVRLGFDMFDVDYDDPVELAAYLADGQAYGPENTVIENSTFREIYNQGFIVYKGNSNMSRNNRYYDVGNDGGTSADVTTSVIRFDQTGNTTIDDWFERTSDLSYSSEYVNVNNANSANYQADVLGPKYLPEVEGVFNYSHSAMHTINPIGSNGNWITAWRLPANQSRSFEIPYTYKSDNADGIRQGTLYVLIDRDNEKICVTDDYEFIGQDTSLVGTGDNLTFRGKLVNITSGDAGDSTNDTAYIEMYNGTAESVVDPLPTITFNLSSRS
jgi:hypothetical protein